MLLQCQRYNARERCLAYGIAAQRTCLAMKTSHFCRQGDNGILDKASHASMDSEFKTHKEEDVVAKILESGDVHEINARFCS
jgi:hypothetical protein